MSPLRLTRLGRQTNPVGRSYIHVADWFATFCSVAGIPGAAAADDATAPRASDSIDAWPALRSRGPGAAVRHVLQCKRVLEYLSRYGIR